MLVDGNCDPSGLGRTTKVGKSGDPQMVVDVCRCSGEVTGELVLVEPFGLSG